MTTPRATNLPGPHATHDQNLVAAALDDDLRRGDRERAQALIQGCSACSELANDLLAIKGATHSLRSGVLASSARRDFRLSSDTAARLSRGEGWRRLLRPFGVQSTASRPLAMAFTTLGLAVLLFSALPMVPFAGGSAATAPSAERLSQPTPDTAGAVQDPGTGQDGSSNEVAAPSPNLEFDAGPLGPTAATPGDLPAPTLDARAPDASAPDAPAPDASGPKAATVAEDPAGPSALAILGAGLVGVGIGLFLLRRLALRLR